MSSTLLIVTDMWSTHSIVTWFISQPNFVRIFIFPPFFPSFMSTWGGRKTSINWLATQLKRVKQENHNCDLRRNWKGWNKRITTGAMLPGAGATRFGFRSFGFSPTNRLSPLSGAIWPRLYSIHFFVIFCRDMFWENLLFLIKTFMGVPTPT